MWTHAIESGGSQRYTAALPAMAIQRLEKALVKQRRKGADDRSNGR